MSNGVEKESMFDAEKAPGVSITDYTLRLKQYCGCSDACYVAALLYIDRLIQTQSKLKITPLSVHRCVIP